LQATSVFAFEKLVVNTASKACVKISKISPFGLTRINEMMLIA
jgi:hypothetical protein